MYNAFFGLQQEPFSIAPDPHYLFMSERHREALAHLLYGLGGGGGFVLLTGEIGAGKTTVCRCFLEQVPENCRVAYVFNPKLTVPELLATVCEEFRIELPAPLPQGESVKPFVDRINAFLLASHAEGRNCVLIIDEAQNLAPEVLEQLRLLTNLETQERKLLQIILIGQPELRGMLARPELEQLAQRVIARYHLTALSADETAQYVRHRLGVAGLRGEVPFDERALALLHRLARGVPRRINLIGDRALLGAYAQGRARVDRKTLARAAAEVFDDARPGTPAWRRGLPWVGGAAVVAAAAWGFGLRAPAAGPARAGTAAAAAASALLPASTAARATSAAASAAPSAPPALVEAIAAAPATPEPASQQLAARWGVVLPAHTELCAAAPSQHLQCFQGEGGLAQLRLLDRPAVLRVAGADGHAGYVLLERLDGQRAELRVGDQRVTLTLAALARQWRGDFTTLWRTPPDYAPGAAAPATLRWLDAGLAQALGQPMASGNAARRERIAAFQRGQGLPADGRMGPVTLMQLGRLLGVAEPRLQEDKN
ncbi:MAG: AAA family ATPase [Pelomonas sp.]|nr:AAA family ATPase [Roseateles sp.]